MSKPSSTHEIVILGANFAGVGVAHYLLRHILPSTTSLTQTAYHVTQISPSDSVFFKIAAPRTLASKEMIPTHKIFFPLSEGFKGYPKEQYNFIKGTATEVDDAGKTVTYTTSGGETETIPYGTLVIATGTTSNSALWTLKGDHSNSVNALEAMESALPAAKTILIAGGGPAGTETAGEIANLFPKAKTTILSGSERLLSRLKPATSKDAEGRLKGMGVEVLHKLRVTKAERLGEGTETSPTKLTMSDGSTREVDIYIDGTGGKPNSSFLPKAWLNQNGYVFTDDKTLRSTVAKNVYAIGDVASYSSGGVLDVNNGVAPVCSSIAIDLVSELQKSKLDTSSSPSPSSPQASSSEQGWGTWLSSFVWSDASSAEPKQKVFKPMADTQFVPIGPKQGVGQVFGWRVPSFMVVMVKGKTYFVEKAEGLLTGADYLKP
ncbi:hypothetical protein MMC25_002186 [Agyrium rufum]|nr:hypothetical protein [Agyrium rufum]